MNKSLNLIVQELKEEVYGVLNKSGLPIIIVSMLMKEISTQLATQTDRIIVDERAQYQHAMAEKEKSSKQETQISTGELKPVK